MPSDIYADIACGLDPVRFARSRLGFDPDPWQAQLLRSTAPRIAINAARQSGKTTTVAVLALHLSLYVPEALTLLVSPSMRQSRLVFDRVMAFLRMLEPVERLEEDNRLSAMLANGSRIVSLPGESKTTRGYSGPALVVEDEASRVDDAIQAVIRPMLAVSGGRLILMSTPAGRRGHFYTAMTGDDDEWERITITAAQCPRITKEFLAKEFKALGDLQYRQEFECEFIDDATAAFATDMVERALDDFEPFLPQTLTRPEGGAPWTALRTP
jgi:hypothetical protein